MAAGRSPDIEEVRGYRNANPVAAEDIAATPGSAEFFERFDATCSAEDYEPYAYSDLVDGYTTSTGKSVLDIDCGNGYVQSRYAQCSAKVFSVDLTLTKIHRVLKPSGRLIFLLSSLVRLAEKCFGCPSNNWLARCCGWNLYTTATKPEKAT